MRTYMPEPEASEFWPELGVGDKPGVGQMPSGDVPPSRMSVGQPASPDPTQPRPED